MGQTPINLLISLSILSNASPKVQRVRTLGAHPRVLDTLIETPLSSNASPLAGI